MKNIKELRDEMVSLFNSVKEDNMDVDKGKVLVSAGNTIIKSAALELEHSKFTGNKKQINFLKTD